MPVTSPYLVESDRYERTFHGWIDASYPDAFTVHARIADPWVGVELVAVTTPSPEYAIRAVEGRVLMGPAHRVDPTLGQAMVALAGVAMTGGFTRRVAGMAGGRVGAGYFIDAATEVARLARQVTRIPEATVRERLGEGPIGFWRLDMGGWVDLPASCYTYRPESEALFRERLITTPMQPALYHPPVGATGIFNRTKTARLEGCEGRLRLAHSMFDEVHSFQIWYEVDLTTGKIVDAGLLTPRLPYDGVCGDPQAKIKDLIGQTVEGGLRKRIQLLIGGSSGCAQLYDLTADLLKLLTVP